MPISSPVRIKAMAMALVLAAAGAACSPIVSYRGYLPDEAEIASISPGVDTKQTVVERLGTPSTIAKFDADTWYYISSEEHQVAWRRPDTVKRTVVAVEFDEQSRVREVNRYNADDGREITPVNRKTPTKGRELTMWEQFFGNIGRLPGPDSGPESPGR